MTTKLPRGFRRIAHFAPYRFNNSVGGIRRARLLGYKQIDQDINLTADEVPVVAHWPIFRKDGFNYIAVSKGTPGARRTRGGYIKRHAYERNTTYAHITWHEASQLRTITGGRVHTVPFHMAQCEKRNIRMMAEVKGDHRFEQAAVAEKFVKGVQNTGADVRIMTLQSLGNPHARLCNFQAHGFDTILLARGRKGVPVAWESCIKWVRGTWRRNH